MFLTGKWVTGHMFQSLDIYYFSIDFGDEPLIEYCVIEAAVHTMSDVSGALGERTVDIRYCQRWAVVFDRTASMH